MTDFVNENRLTPFDLQASNGVDLFTAANIVPHGWIPLLYLMFEAAERLHSQVDRAVWDSRGIMRFTINPELSDVTNRDLLRRISDTIAKDSAKVCLVCGNFGYRRKSYDNWPCLCRDHYIIYANAVG